MKKINSLLVSFTMACLLATTHANAGQCPNPGTIDAFQSDVEQRLPVLEKYAELWVKLLSNDKHLAKIKKDLKGISNGSLRNAENTHLLKAIKFFKISLDQLQYSGNINAQVTSPKFFINVPLGGICSYPSLERSLPSLTPQQMEKSAEQMNRIIETLTPVYMLASEKLSDTDMKGISFKTYGSVAYQPNYTYAILDHNRNLSYSSPPFNFLEQNPQGATFFMDNKVPTEYLDMLKNYVQFLSVIPSKNKPRKPWAYFSTTLDSIMAEMAEGGGMFSDLDDAPPANNGGEAPGNDDSGDLNFDDLKLPE